MNKQIMFGMAAVVLMLLFSAGIAAAIPARPADYSGTVTINGTPAPDGTKVFAQVNKTTGYVYQTNPVTVASGKYLNLMVNVEAILEETDLGMPVRFYIQKPGENACLASPTTPFSSGPHTQDLTLVLPPCIAPLTPSTGPTPTATATGTTPVPTGTSTGSSGGSGSGSTGGGGVISAEPYDNVFKSEKRDGTLTANKPVTFSFTTPELAIYQVVITGKESENDVSVKIESLKNTSKLVKRPAPGTVYVNENVWVNSQRIKEVLIRFRVKNAWIDSSSAARGDIKLLKWQNNNWTSLETGEVNKDGTYTYFESRSSGLSSFAISAVKAGAVPSETPPSPVATTPEKTVPIPTKPGRIPGFEIGLVLIALSALYILGSKRR